MSAIKVLVGLESSLRPLSLACRWSHSPCVFTCSALCSYVYKCPLYYKDTQSYWLGIYSNDFIYFVKDSVTKYSLILRYWGLFQHKGTGGKTVQVIIIII